MIMSVVGRVGRYLRLPLYPDEQMSLPSDGMSQWCHMRKWHRSRNGIVRPVKAPLSHVCAKVRCGGGLTLNSAAHSWHSADKLRAAPAYVGCAEFVVIAFTE